MKKLIPIVIAGFVFLTSFLLIFKPNEIITSSKVYNSANDQNVSTRELVLLASLTYEDVPNDYKYEKLSTSGKGCIDNFGNLISNCNYTATDDFARLKGSKYDITYYIEGLSQRKMNSIVSLITSAFKEDGEAYYFLNFANTAEMQNWKIFDYSTKDTQYSQSLLNLFGIDSVDWTNWDGIFDVVTFKKGNNYVISYRGTDYPDFLEWAENVAYALEGNHVQAALAYQYAYDVYDKIMQDSNNQANIYVTGHSLGAYLAQVGGAAIVDKEAGKTANREVISFNNLTEYTDYYKPSSGMSHLKQVAYFNGMGVGSLFFPTKKFIKNIDDSLIYLSTHDETGNISNTNKKVNYSDTINSSSRLVLYSMDSDPVSSIGFHYGEIYKLDTAADAVTHHKNNHANILGDLIQILAKSAGNVSEAVNKKVIEQYAAQAGYIDSVSNSLYNIINIEGIIQNNDNYLPSFIVKHFKDNYNINIIKYNLFSLLNSLTLDVTQYSKKYGVINNLFDHFNINHETDSFACLIDNEHGQITESSVNLKAYSSNFKTYSETNSFYANKISVNSKYVLGEDVSRYTGNNIVLQANIEGGGCAKNYTWSIYDGNKWQIIYSGYRNEIILPRKYMKTTQGKTNYKIKVEVSYGNEFQETKARINKSTNLFVYDKQNGSKTTVNPTLNDGITNSSGTVSKEIDFSVTYDTQPPKCSFSTSNIQIKKGATNTISLVCEDTSPVILSADKIVQKWLGIKNQDSTFFDITPVCNPNSVNKNCTIQITGKKSLFRGKRTLIYDGKVEDYAGNKASVSNSTILNLIKK